MATVSIDPDDAQAYAAATLAAEQRAKADAVARSMPLETHRENGDLLASIYRRALQHTSDALDERVELANGQGEALPIQTLGLSIEILKKMLPSPADAHRITAPVKVDGFPDLASATAAVAEVTAMAFRGEIGIGEAKKLHDLLETTAKMHWAADVDRADRLREVVERHALEHPQKPAQALTWGRFKEQPVEDAEPAAPAMPPGIEVPDDW